MGAGNQYLRTQYLYKESEYLDMPASISANIVVQGTTTASGSNPAFIHLTGNLDTTAEGIYYFTLRVTTRSFSIDNAVTDLFACKYDDYGFYWNDKDFP
jgi:hypothetical protein